MTRTMTRAELLAALPDLTPEALDTLVGEGIISPVHSDTGPMFRDIDAARIRLAMELEDSFALDMDGLAMVLSLIDQLNGVRGDMRAVLGALAEEPPETRARLRAVIETHVVRFRRT